MPPRRYAAQLCLNRVEVVRRDDGRREEGIAICGNDQSKIHKAAEPDAVVFHNVDNIAEGDLSLRSIATLVCL